MPSATRHSHNCRTANKRADEVRNRENVLRVGYIEDLTFLDKEQPALYDDDRSLIYDIYCTTDNGRLSQHHVTDGRFRCL